MSEEPKFRLSLVQVLAGALAAASAAVASSWLGVAGTVIGAVVMSVVASVASVLYAHPIERGSDKLKAAMPPIRPLPVTAGMTAVHPGSTVTGETPSVHAGSFADTRATGTAVALEPAADPEESRDERAGLPPRRFAWRTVVAGATAMLVVGLSLLTGFELLSGSPLTVSGARRQGDPSIVQVIRGGEANPTGPTRTDDPDGGSDSSGTGGSSDPSGPVDGGNGSADPDPGAASNTGPGQPQPEPTPAEPRPTEPEPTEPEPTEPEPTEPEPTEPTPTTPAPTAPTTQPQQPVD